MLTISHKTSSCSQDNLVTLNKKNFTSRNRLSSAFSKIFFSKKSNKAAEHHITMPTTYRQNATFGLPTLQYREAVSSCQDLSKGFQRTSDTAKLSSSVDVLHSDPETAMIRTEKLLPPMQPNAINQLSGQPNNPKLHFRSTMPLPLTPLDLAISRNSSVSATSTCTDSISMDGSIGRGRSSSDGNISNAAVQESSKTDSVFADETDSVAKSDKDSDPQVKKHNPDYESVYVDFESILSLLFNSSATTTADGETDDNKDLITPDVQIGTDIYDEIKLECVTHADQCTCEHEEYDTSDMGDYTFMHATTCPHLVTASHTYDYVDQFYITMLRQNYKKYDSSVPPQKVNCL